MDQNDATPRKKLAPIYPSSFQRIQNKMECPPIIIPPSNNNNKKKKILLRAQGLLEKLWANMLLPRIVAENVTANICWIFNWNKRQQYASLEMQREA